MLSWLSLGIFLIWTLYVAHRIVLFNSPMSASTGVPLWNSGPLKSSTLLDFKYETFSFFTSRDSLTQDEQEVPRVLEMILAAC